MKQECQQNKLEEKEGLYRLVCQLTELPGMVGFEKPVIDFLKQTWQPYVMDIWQTPVGNLVAHIGGCGPRLVFVAHADEIGFIVRHIDEEGFLWISPKSPTLGRPGRECFLIGQPALVQTSTGSAVSGIFATISGHVTPAVLREKPSLTWDDVFVDLGVADVDEVRSRGIQVGDAVIWNPPTKRLGDLIVGKAMDDRVGLAILTLLLSKIDRKKLTFDVFFAATVQEEMGLIGAGSLQNSYDYAIILDVGLAGDVPGVTYKDVPTKLGGGPIFVHHDKTVHYATDLTLALAACAEESGIEVQHAVFPHYSSDGAELIKHGIPAALVAFPARYTHSPFETVHIGDLVRCVNLLECFLSSTYLKG